MENNKQNEEIKKVQNWVKFSQIGLQMAVTIALFTWLGYWLDGKMENKKPIITIIFSLASIGVSLYNVIRQLPKE